MTTHFPAERIDFVSLLETALNYGSGDHFVVFMSPMIPGLLLAEAFDGRIKELFVDLRGFSKLGRHDLINHITKIARELHNWAREPYIGI